mmetsp:Transcript_47062/g.111624  ORF Transcript_47062/g.111624 Transcript_47062/m.111624 type:complete len:245 (+) Transcript_47062:20-754(+)
MPTLARSCGAIVASLQATRRAIVPTASHVRAAPVCWSGVARAQPARCLNSHAPTSFPSRPLQQARALIQRPLEARSNAAASFHASAVSHKQVFVGTVVSDKPQKTVVVSVTKISTHPFYKVMVKKRRKYMAHDELDAFKLGDKVVIEQWRPLSKHKCWMVTGYADREKEAQVGPERKAKIAELTAAKEAARAERWKEQAAQAVVDAENRKIQKKERRIRSKAMQEQAAEEEAKRKAEKRALENE